MRHLEKETVAKRAVSILRSKIERMSKEANSKITTSLPDSSASNPSAARNVSMSYCSSALFFVYVYTAKLPEYTFPKLYTNFTFSSFLHPTSVCFTQRATRETSHIPIRLRAYIYSTLHTIRIDAELNHQSEDQTTEKTTRKGTPTDSKKS